MSMIALMSASGRGGQPGTYTSTGTISIFSSPPLAIAEYAEMGNFGMRVVMSYQPNTLAQQFTVDVLYGVGVLRNSFGVQVNS